MPHLESFERKGSQLWKKRDGGFVYIESTVLETINNYKQFSPKMAEAGGFLAGYYKGSDLHIIDLTVPLQGDKRGRNYFKRRDLFHVEQIKNWYAESEGEINCLGEWHTHPESYPHPSSIDVRGWRVFNQGRSGQQAIFLIAGTIDIWLGEY